MAAFDETSGPDLKLFAGCTWSDWQNAVESEAGYVLDNECTSSRHKKEFARLKKKDFSLFGYCPAKDNFYVVVCEICQRPFKPQAFYYHMENSHKVKVQTLDSLLGPDNETVVASIPTKLHKATKQNFDIKSPTSNESSDSSATYSSRVKKPHKATLSNAIKHALHKAVSPPGSLSTNSLAVKRKLDSSKVKWHFEGTKSSPSTTSSLSPNNEKRESALNFKATHPADVLTAGDKPMLEHKPTLSEHGKLHKHISSINSKPHKTKSKNLSKNNETSQSNKKHDSRSRHSSSKTVSKYSLVLPLENITSSKLQHKSDLNEENHVSNGPIVVLEKSPILEKKETLSTPQTKLKKTNLPNRGHKPRSVASAPSPFRQYKHHHNPQLDIVKSADRGDDLAHRTFDSSQISLPREVSSKQRKNLPLKALDYDPNKHCGVLLPDDLPCTHSLTCKIHSKSTKRKVLGRVRPYDELVKAKQRLKGHLSTIPSPSSQQHSVPEPLKDPGIRGNLQGTSSQTIQPKVEAQTSVISQIKAPSSNADKTFSQSTTKTKVSFHLFPRSTTPRYIECWQEDVLGSFHWNVDCEQALLNNHPSPLLVQHYGSDAMGHSYSAFHKRADSQWKEIFSALKEDKSKNTQKPSFTALSSSSRTNFKFNPIPSVSRSLLTSLKSAKSTAKHQKLQCLREQECNFCNSKSLMSETYANNFVTVSSNQQKQFPNQKKLSKSLSFNEDAVTKRTSSSNINRRIERHTIDHPSDPPLSKSPRCSMPLDHRLIVEGHSNAANPLHGKFVQLSNNSSDFSANTSNFHVNSYFMTEQNAGPSNDNDLAVVNQSAPSFFPNKSLRGRRVSKGRKDSLPPSITQTITHNNHFTQRHFSDDPTQFLHSNDIGTKRDVSLVNGLSSNAVQSHQWPQSVTLSGTIGALMQTNTMANTSNQSSITINLSVD